MDETRTVAPPSGLTGVLDTNRPAPRRAGNTPDACPRSNAPAAGLVDGCTVYACGCRAIPVPQTFDGVWWVRAVACADAPTA